MTTPGQTNDHRGFTLLELVMVIVILAILAVTAAVKWPSGMKEKAALLEFTRALRYAQHKALTKEYTGAATAWGITISGTNQYSIGRRDGSEMAEGEYVNRSLLDDPAISLGPVAGVYFNGLGEPIAAGGAPLTTSPTFSINGASPVTICQQTGFVMEGATCP